MNWGLILLMSSHCHLDPPLPPKGCTQRHQIPGWPVESPRGQAWVGHCREGARWGHAGGLRAGCATVTQTRGCNLPPLRGGGRSLRGLSGVSQCSDGHSCQEEDQMRNSASFGARIQAENLGASEGGLGSPSSWT